MYETIDKKDGLTDDKASENDVTYICSWRSISGNDGELTLRWFKFAGVSWRKSALSLSSIIFGNGAEQLRWKQIKV